MLPGESLIFPGENLAEGEEWFVLLSEARSGDLKESFPTFLAIFLIGFSSFDGLH